MWSVVSYSESTKTFWDGCGIVGLLRGWRVGREMAEGASPEFFVLRRRVADWGEGGGSRKKRNVIGKGEGGSLLCDKALKNGESNRERSVAPYRRTDSNRMRLSVRVLESRASSCSLPLAMMSKEVRWEVGGGSRRSEFARLDWTLKIAPG